LAILHRATDELSAPVNGYGAAQFPGLGVERRPAKLVAVRDESLRRTGGTQRAGQPVLLAEQRVLLLF
jgi:hypothetical protein